MEPPLPPLHPRVPELLGHLKLRLVDAVKWNVLACVEEGDDGGVPTCVIKFGSEPRRVENVSYESRLMREVLPSLGEGIFERLVIPEYLADGTFEEVRWMKMRYVPGLSLIHSWSELNFKPETLGGRGIGAEVAVMAVDILRDLRLVDISSLPDFVRRFRFDDWLSGFRLKSETLIAQGLFDRSTVNHALGLFTAKAAARYEGNMFTNGDFYPRNFIMLPEGKIAITDWVGGVDPWGFVAMYAWILMWGNEEWRSAYVAAIKAHFPIDVEEMQIGLLVKSFDQIYRWRDLPEEHIGLARARMLTDFREFLDVEKVREIFK